MLSYQCVIKEVLSRKTFLEEVSPQTSLQELLQLPKTAFLKKKMPPSAITTNFLERGCKKLLCDKSSLCLTLLKAHRYQA